MNISYVELSHGSVHYVIDRPGNNVAPTDNIGFTENIEDNWAVLLHGFSAPSYIWESTSQRLVKAGYQVLRFDLYGRGFSDRPQIDYNTDLFVEQLHELLDKLKIETPINLVGLSMGGPISTRFSHQFPEKVKSLSLLAPLVETPKRVDVKLLTLPVIGEYLSTVLMMPKIKNDNESSFYTTESYPEWHAKMDEHIFLIGYRRALLSTVRYLNGRSFADDYQKLAKAGTLTQLIWGKNDQVVPLAQSETILDAFPEASIHTLDKTGHLPQLEQTDEVAILLVKHFNQASN